MLFSQNGGLNTADGEQQRRPCRWVVEGGYLTGLRRNEGTRRNHGISLQNNCTEIPISSDPFHAASRLTSPIVGRNYLDPEECVWTPECVFCLFFSLNVEAAGLIGLQLELCSQSRTAPPAHL